MIKLNFEGFEPYENHKKLFINLLKKKGVTNE